MIRLLILLCVCFGLFAQTGTGDDWSRVTRLQPGTRVDVIHKQLKSVSGDFVSATDLEIVVRTGAGTEAVRREDTMRVSAHTRSRKKRALIGMAVGAGAGAIVAIAAASSGDVDLRYSYIGAAGALLGGGAGAAIGAVSGGPVTVYRAPRR